MPLRSVRPRNNETNGVRRSAGKRRLALLVTGLLVLAAMVPLAVRIVARSADASTGTSHTDTAQPETTATTVAQKGVTIAWNPSHQDDTGSDGWHEYAVCGDIAQQAMALLPDSNNVLCWETGMGLTTNGGAALRSECATANAAHAQIFIAVHVNGGGQSGVTGTYYAGDETSRQYAEALLQSISAAVGMTFHHVRPRSDIFVLNPLENHAPIRVLLELGDNEADRALLTSKDGVRRMAAALAKAVEENGQTGRSHPSTEAPD
jgi:N-acetylmuramoyl-L-alanine amidase